MQDNSFINLHARIQVAKINLKSHCSGLYDEVVDANFHAFICKKPINVNFSVTATSSLPMPQKIEEFSSYKFENYLIPYSKPASSHS
jgi:hypothetical protein